MVEYQDPLSELESLSESETSAGNFHRCFACGLGCRVGVVLYSWLVVFAGEVPAHQCAGDESSVKSTGVSETRPVRYGCVVSH